MAEDAAIAVQMVYVVIPVVSIKKAVASDQTLAGTYATTTLITDAVTSRAAPAVSVCAHDISVRATRRE